MALNRVTKQFAVTAAVNTWVQVPLTLTGKNGVVRTRRQPSTKYPEDTIEIALSVAAPAGAGTVLPRGEASEYLIMNAATHTLWVRRTTANTSGPVLDIDPLVNGNVLSATA